METKTHTHLTLEERRRIYFLLGRKMAVVEIARQLSRHHSTIYREIRRNSFWDVEEHKNNDYYPLLQEQLGMKSYFCDPQAPWQKGGVESNNKRIRRFLPSHTNLKDVSNADLYKISVIMNKTPRKCLGYRTPQEVLDEYLLEAA